LLSEESGIGEDKMKLKLDPRWKYIAKTISGSVKLFTEQPFARTSEKSWVKEGYWSTRNDSDPLTRGQGVTFIFEDFYNGDWQDSLHEIMPDGSLRKVKDCPYIPIDAKVLVKAKEEDNWQKKHFAGWSETGRIRCWMAGATSYSADGASQWNFWKLYEDEK
jgi:hypothetical protein